MAGPDRLVAEVWPVSDQTGRVLWCVAGGTPRVANESGALLHFRVFHGATGGNCKAAGVEGDKACHFVADFGVAAISKLATILRPLPRQEPRPLSPHPGTWRAPDLHNG